MENIFNTWWCNLIVIIGIINMPWWAISIVALVLLVLRITTNLIDKYFENDREDELENGNKKNL